LQKLESVKEELDRNGFVLIKDALESAELREIERQLELIPKTVIDSSAGTRNLLRRSDWIRGFVEDFGKRIIGKDFGAQPHAVRGILFSKTSEANWFVRWHQDRTIPVVEKQDVDGFAAWSEKDGVPHCYPPAHVLENMLAIRIHIDEAKQENGAIKFIKGSHAHGILDDDEKARLLETGTRVTVVADPGDIILMRPLILHSSSKSISDDPRRVLHIEYATEKLPPPLEWGTA
jgi:ectoine hydroxylase-related dioxygenase (phytanoyl-CoA dioxygenase family)